MNELNISVLSSLIVINGINIFNTYLQTYDKTQEVIEYNEIDNETSAIKKTKSLLK